MTARLAAAYAPRVGGGPGSTPRSQRWITYAEHKKRPVIANVVARELAGWCWSLACYPSDRPPADRGGQRPRLQREERRAPKL